MESCACKEPTLSVRPNKAHVAIDFSFIVYGMVQLQVQKSGFCPRSPIPIIGDFRLHASLVMRMYKHRTAWIVFHPASNTNSKFTFWVAKKAYFCSKLSLCQNYLKPYCFSFCWASRLRHSPKSTVLMISRIVTHSNKSWC